jgi:hypothetical protein
VRPGDLLFDLRSPWATVYRLKRRDRDEWLCDAYMVNDAGLFFAFTNARFTRGFLETLSESR